MGKQYYLTNGSCRFQVKNGILYSAGAVRDAAQTEYINETRGFGSLSLAYVFRGEQAGWEPLKTKKLTDEGVQRQGRKLSYRCHAENECLSVDVSYVLDKDTLHEKITVTNLTREPVELEDFGISLSCHTDFGWGKDASGEVLGHHFVAGHGSHSTFSRCDGTGPVFTAMPAPGSQ